MKKISSSKLLLVFSAIGLFVYSIIYACSDNGDWGWAFDSNFTPETFVDKSNNCSQYLFVFKHKKIEYQRHKMV